MPFCVSLELEQLAILPANIYAVIMHVIQYIIVAVIMIVVRA